MVRKDKEIKGTPHKLNFFHQQFGKSLDSGLDRDNVKVTHKFGLRVFFYGFVHYFSLHSLIPQITELALFINLRRISYFTLQCKFYL